MAGFKEGINMGFIIGLLVVDVLAFWGLWYVIFKDRDDFVESVRNLLTPDIVSIFR